MSEPGLFANESVPYAPFKTVGTEYAGVVIRTSKVQQTAYVTKRQRDAGVQGEPLWWDTAKTRPKEVSIVTIQTDLRDPDILGDNGQRSLWISGKQMETAAKKAVADSGASKDGIKPGGYFSMKFTHETPTEGENVSPTKHYVATYRPPSAGGAFADDPWAQPQNPFDGWGVPVQAPGQPMPQPTAPGQAYAAPAQAGLQQPQGTPPDTQAMINKLLQQQQGGTQ